MRAIAFFRSLLIVACVAVGSPIALAAVSRWRFGSASPLHGVPGPDRWSAGGARSLLAAPLTERTLGDVAIRLAVLVVWVAVLVFVLTVVVEAVHQCISTRGVCKPGVRLVTSRMLGAFRANPATRREFLSLIGDRREGPIG